MKTIPEELNGVKLEFSSKVNRDITNELYAAMEHSINTDVGEGKLERLWVSSANDQHQCPSRHATGNGIDISRVNGLKMSLHYPSDNVAKKIVENLQDNFENAPRRRENYGPYFKKKEGQNKVISGHTDHIHWSVNGDHSNCSSSVFIRFLNSIKNFFGTKDRDEVCEL